MKNQTEESSGSTTLKSDTTTNTLRELKETTLYYHDPITNTASTAISSSQRSSGT